MAGYGRYRQERGEFLQTHRDQLLNTTFVAVLALADTNLI